MAKSKNIIASFDDAESLIREQRNTSTQQHTDTTTQVVSNTITNVDDNKPTKIRAQRTNGSTYYLEDYLRKKMKMASAIHEIELQNIVRASVDYFFRQFGEDNGMGLTDTGVRLIEEYIAAMEERAMKQ